MIAVVTNYYNPANKRRKRRNFQVFLAHMNKSPLFIVEAAFGNMPFMLPSDDKTLQVRCRDVIWQQYTLVNLAIKSLPDCYDKVVWVDADILFEQPNWWEHMSDMLDEYKIVQSYEEVIFLDPDGKEQTSKSSVTKIAYENSLLPHNTAISSCLDLDKKYASGFSWGVRREFIEKFRIYDYWITGSCDTALAIAIYGDFKNSFIPDRLNPKMKQHFMDWAIQVFEYVDGDISYLDGRIRHLWHGERNYKKRWQCIRDLDPYTDIKINTEGVLQWCSDKPSMHRCCKQTCETYDNEFLRMYL